ncbi:hypothetical protein CHELA1G11_13707 [Hyphomicrobiales bacterium]|nr:hypothetical protein CHELA1G2_10608 [Hyphomicrobiales bacterium]CAH1673479.1 hypothetical protein CHELA1G11_13707 [Hyphomicrobiales bacterium]
MPLETTPSRQAKWKASLETQGVRQINILAPEAVHGMLKEIARRTRAGEPMEGVLRTLVRPRERNTAEKQADVRRMLMDNPDLSDREIARRVHVSPQTVNNWRKKLDR